MRFEEEYVQLSTQTLLSYLNYLHGIKLQEVQLTSLFSKFGEPSTGWQIQEIGDGNLNFVYTVKSDTGTFLVKQAIPFIRCIGPSWPLTQERAFFESTALKEQAKYSCNVPEVYFYDPKQCTIIEEFLFEHTILREELISKTELPHLYDQMATYLSSTLYHNSTLHLPVEEFMNLVHTFSRNSPMIDITATVIFTQPYQEHSNNHWTSELDALVASKFRDSALNPQLFSAVFKLKQKFLTNAEALLHGDLHTGSIMVTHDSLRVIDAEFAFIGPMSFDVGQYMAHMILSYYAQEEKDPYKCWLVKQIESFWNTFVEKFIDLWKEPNTTLRRHYFQTLFHDSCGMAALELVRRIIGVAHVNDFESIIDVKERSSREAKALNLAYAILSRYDTQDAIDSLSKLSTALLEV